MQVSCPKPNIVFLESHEESSVKENSPYQSKFGILKNLANLAKDLDGVNKKEYSQMVTSYDEFIRNREQEYWYVLEKLSMDCNHNTIKHPDWSLLGGRIYAQRLWAESMKSFSELFLTLPKLDGNIEKFVKAHAKELDDLIVKDRDLNFTIFAIRTLEKSYLIRNLDGKIETPQGMWMRVAVQIGYPDLKTIKKVYDHLSSFYYAHATPTLFNASRKKNQMASCFLGAPDDSVESIGEWWKRCAIISQNSGGIGLDFSLIRMSELSTGESTTGLGGWLEIVEKILEKVDQSRKRKGSLTAYLNVAHAGVIDFIRCKEEKAHGDCAPKLFYGLMMSKLFIERYYSGGLWSLFCPNKSPNVFKTYGKEFRQAYLEAETNKEYIKQLPASEVMAEIVMMQIKKGMPFIINLDAINEYSNQRHTGMIRCSNLCTEIAENTSDGEIASCNLASISLTKCVKTKGNGEVYFDFDHLEEMASQLVENLNSIIDRNYYPDSIPIIKTTNLKHRPLGIGVQGLADVFAKLGLSWIIREKSSESETSWRTEFVINPQARKLNREIFETIYYGAIKKSCELAKNYGPYETFKGSDISKGVFQWNKWEGENAKSPLDSRYGEKVWEEMRENVMKGIRNSLLVSLMPTASTSHILGNTEAFEPITENLYKRTVLSGQFTIINKYMVKDLEEIGLWNNRTSKLLIKTKGSIQAFTLPTSDPRCEKLENIKLKYRTAFEIPQRIIHIFDRDRSPFVCQTQSANRFYTAPTTRPLCAMICAGFELGLKTINYYIRTLPAADPINYALDSEEDPSVDGEEMYTKDVLIPKLLDSSILTQKPAQKRECTDDICIKCQS